MNRANPRVSGGRTFLPLSGSQRFDSVFALGKRVRRGGITVVAAPGGEGPPRVGLVAGRRVGGAVVRNLAKRRLRAALDQAKLEDGFDYVVIASPAVAAAKFATVAVWVREATAGAASIEERA